MYIQLAMPICLRLLMHWVEWALDLARDRDGRSIEARIAIIAINTSSSISVNAGWRGDRTNGNRGLITLWLISIIRGKRQWRLQPVRTLAMSRILRQISQAANGLPKVLRP